ncbi:DUF441 domain-containing protein [Effusibacillus consociatus]|uniref:UPF0756 membrane protein ACFO8Q_10570 n=1 Tax=Effusibacillus consociatus TaxID=1117041 RepID=A0ABV9PZX3_9BACL
MAGDRILVILIIVGIIGEAKIVAIAASVLLIIKLMKFQRFLPTLERRGLELGLLFLMIAILVPLVDGQVQSLDLLGALSTVTGIAALLGGILATSLNGPGLTMLRMEPQLMVGIMLGSIIGIVFLDGIPVGPLTASAIVFVLMRSYLWIKR